MRLLLATLALTGAVAAGAVPATAAVKPGWYSGETDAGYEMSFKVVGNKVKRLNGMVPTSCVSVDGGTRAGGEIFKPPGSFAFGKTRRVTALQDPAMHYSNVTKHYRVTLNKPKRGRFSAKLHVNFSFQTVGYNSSGPYLQGWVCQGDDSFRVR